MIAKKYPEPQHAIYVLAAEKMRIPYWDWMLYPQLPRAVTNTSLQINTPSGVGQLDNPIFRYKFPVNMLDHDYFPRDRNVSALPTTVRNFNPTTGQSDQMAASISLARLSTQTQDAVKRLFNISPNYTFFASYSAGAGASIEAIHGDIHDAIGGVGPWAGHMTVIPMSSFDPVFWLHHANMDRLLAIFQAIYPDHYVEPFFNPVGTYYQPANQFDTINTPLAPFHQGNASDMWTAATARDTAAFGYTYPELLDWKFSSIDLAAQARQIFDAMYGPP